MKMFIKREVQRGFPLCWGLRELIGGFINAPLPIRIADTPNECSEEGECLKN